MSDGARQRGGDAQGQEAEVIKKSAKPEHVEKTLERLDAADACLCNAGLTNVLTKRGDEWLLRMVRQLRAFRRMIEDKREPTE